MSEILKRIRALSPSEQKIAGKKYLQVMLRQSLALTAQHLCGYKDLNPRTHGNTVRALESPKRRKLIVLPRGSLKSSLCSVAFPIWCLNRNPNLRILLDSELYTNSKNLLREIKTHLESAFAVEMFGRYKTESCWNESEIIIAQRTKNYKEASITASGIGAEKTGQHYDMIVMDDMNSPNNSSTKEGLEKVIQHFKYATSILDPGGTLVIVGTRYSESDLIGYCLDNLVEPK